MARTGRRKNFEDEFSKLCSHCREIKLKSEFTGTERTCKLCKKKRHIKRKYGIEWEEYNSMFEEQNGLCAICLSKKPTYVDHCHDTGKVRALLCPNCNTGIGLFFEDIDLIHRAINYIESHRKDIARA